MITDLWTSGLRYCNNPRSGYNHPDRSSTWSYLPWLNFLSFGSISTRVGFIRVDTACCAAHSLETSLFARLTLHALGEPAGHCPICAVLPDRVWPWLIVTSLAL